MGKPSVGSGDAFGARDGDFFGGLLGGLLLQSLSSSKATKYSQHNLEIYAMFVTSGSMNSVLRGLYSFKVFWGGAKVSWGCLEVILEVLWKDLEETAIYTLEEKHKTL